MRRVYFDHNATTPLAPDVLRAMTPYLTEEYGNASSIHSVGQRARAAVEQARAEVAALLGAREKEAVFTSGGTEADNLAIRGVVGAAERPAKHVITSTIEHHAVLNTCQALEAEGVRVTYVPVNAAGLVDPEDVHRAITADTVLITVMHANNELGTVQPIAEIAKIARERRIPFHTDAVQSVGKLPVNVKELGADLLSLSAHKLYGPKGTGALYIRGGLPMKPLMFGGHHERDRRPGTENVAGIVGLGAAAALAAKHLAEAAPHAEHDEHPFRFRRGRSAGHCARLEGHRLFDRGRLLLWRGRALARADRHRPPARARPRQPALLARPREHPRRRQLRG